MVYQKLLVKRSEFSLPGKKVFLKNDGQYETILADAAESPIHRQKKRKSITNQAKRKETPSRRSLEWLS